MESNNFGYDAPQFLDFENIHVQQEQEDRHRIEAYFDCDHETPSTNRIDMHHAEMSDDDETDFTDDDRNMFYTPMNNKDNRRLSKSMVCLSEIAKYEEVKDSISEEYDQDVDKTLSESINKIEIQPTKASGPNSTRRRCNSENRASRLRRANSATRISQLSKPKETVSKYMSMQEMMRKFESTPNRFHTKPKSAVPLLERTRGPIPNTIPHSPALATKVRSRPTTAISAKERELQEIEAIKSFKIKANPVNHKILGPMKPIHITKKSPTHVVPFNLTQVSKKPTSSTREKETPTEFHAQPMPVSMNGAPKLPTVTKKTRTQPVTPMVLKRRLPRYAIPVPKEPEPPKPLFQCSRTVPEPFSFEQRNREVLRKKEQKMQEELEKAKKMREFHARPLPKAVYQEPSMPVKLTRGAAISMESIKSSRSDEGVKPFKARPPVSIMQEPFIPKKAEKPLVEISPFQLNTEKRARERHLFDEKMKEREEMLEKLRKAEEEEQRELEERLKLENRKKTEYKAQPIRKFKEVPYIPAKKVTMPHGPNFLLRQQKCNNKENLDETQNTDRSLQ